ncbi:hypothetical protein ABPG74_020436 [Tetrahymena malaccensis]
MGASCIGKRRIYYKEKEQKIISVSNNNKYNQYEEPLLKQFVWIVSEKLGDGSKEALTMITIAAANPHLRNLQSGNSDPFNCPYDPLNPQNCPCDITDPSCTCWIQIYVGTILQYVYTC